MSLSSLSRPEAVKTQVCSQPLNPSYQWRTPAYSIFRKGRTWDPGHTPPATQVLGEKLYLSSRNVSSVISPADLFPGSSAGRRVLGPWIWERARKGRDLEFGRSAEAPGTVRRGQGTKDWRGGRLGREVGQPPQDSQMPGIPLAHSGYIWYEFQAVCRPLHV